MLKQGGIATLSVEQSNMVITLRLAVKYLLTRLP